MESQRVRYSLVTENNFILFDVMINMIIFLTSLLHSSLLVYGNATSSSVLILYPATLPNSLMIYSSFCVCVCVGSLGFSILWNSDSFIFSFPIWILFISFSCLISVARICYIMLNKIGKCRHPFLVPHLRENAFTFHCLIWL